MKKYLYIICGCLVFLSCRREFEAPVPDTAWDLFDSPSATRLASFTRNKTEGVYTLDEGADAFGSLTAAKWSYTANGTDTVYHLSFFLGRAGAYFICEGKQRDSSILLNGYWRRMTTTETGKVRLTITKEAGARHLLQQTPFNPATDNMTISGVYSLGNTTPDLPITLRYTRPLRTIASFEVLAHRGGGRSADLLPASENSMEMIKLASQFGATGIEIDVRMTKDGVPILFHDATLNERVIQKNGLLGPIENYTFNQLQTLVRLPKGERIPTLRQALDAVVYSTPLDFVWLDTKYNGSLQILKDIQAEYRAKAASINRSLDIVIGIPDKDVLKNFKQLPSYQNVPSLVELEQQDVRDVNARVWAPQWTLGLQNDEVAQTQSEGRRAFTWTLDVPENIEDYMKQGRFNGILSNYPSIVAYYYYVAP
ncbi:MAG: glycerophosphodiester phosphodiesterase [Chitinophagaceae bacterium]|nr:MAG: glycerophosphodiester phosphodiesterase [Chitinophagaceae bacterium]